MAYLDTHTRTSKPTSNDLFQPGGRMPALFGVFVGFVKDAADVQKNGRLRVWVPELGSAPDNEEGWIIVNYCSPFAGATNVDSANSNDVKSFEGTQTSYGMWMIPPDINNQVLIMFINGDPSRGIWIGCLYNQFMNNMVPAMSSSSNNYQYQGKEVPVAEYNKNDAKINKPDQATKPYEATKFNGLGNQGLIADPVRGVTSSSARRESPSQVFGIITPGPAIKKNVDPDKIRRKGGSSFVMDDKDGSEYVQLSTKSGAQININETNGFIYLINRDGTTWVQMDQAGNIDIFGAKNISMRAQCDVNIRADRNINMEAGQNIFMKAAKDTKKGTTSFTYDVNNVPKPTIIPVWEYVGEGKGEGGNIVMQALNSWHSTTQKSAFLTVVENNMNINVTNSLSVTTKQGGQDYNSKQGVKVTTTGAYDVNALGNVRVTTPGSANVIGEAGVVVCTSGDLNLKAASNIIGAAGGNISLSATNLGVTAKSLFSDTVGISGKVNMGSDANVVGSLSASSSSFGSTVTGALSGAGGGPLSGSLSLTGSVTASAVNADNMTSLHYGTGSSSPGSAGSPPTPGAGPAAPTELNPATAQGAMIAESAKRAEIKPLNEKLNILATWKTTTTYFEWDPRTFYHVGNIVKYKNILYKANKEANASATFVTSSWDIFIQEEKFKRDSQSLQTTVSTFPTYEPCPEHAAFKLSTVAGFKPVITADDKSYEGSAGAGNTAAAAPATASNPGANNVAIQGDPPAATSVSRDLNINAFRCQLSIHEGVKNKSYADSLNLVTGGIGHLMRANELPLYPVGTPILDEQIESWYSQDSSSAIKIAQQLFPDLWGDLSDVRKRALADLSYNVGKNRLSKFVNFIAAMNAKDFSKAGTELKDSAWFRQVGRRGPNIIAMIVQNVDPNGCDRRFPE